MGLLEALRGQSAMGFSLREKTATLRAQSAMEFLMTYGWAILLMLVVVSVLFYMGVLSPRSVAPNSLAFPAGFTAYDYQLDSSARLYLDLGQAVGEDINILSVLCAREAGGDSPTGSSPITSYIGNGDHEIVANGNILCQGASGSFYKGKVTVYYTRMGSQFVKKVVGDLSHRIEAGASEAFVADAPSGGEPAPTNTPISVPTAPAVACSENSDCESEQCCGGECGYCGDGWCGPEEKESSCPQDCSGNVLSCVPGPEVIPIQPMLVAENDGEGGYIQELVEEEYYVDPEGPVCASNVQVFDLGAVYDGLSISRMSLFDPACFSVSYSDSYSVDGISFEGEEAIVVTLAPIGSCLRQSTSFTAPARYVKRVWYSEPGGCSPPVYTVINWTGSVIVVPTPGDNLPPEPVATHTPIPSCYAGGVISSCPCSIDERGDYVLESDLISSGDDYHCIVFHDSAGGSTLNCDGHTLTGNGLGPGIDILYADDLIIQDCVIEGFGSGISMHDSDGSIFSTNHISGGEYGFRLMDGSSSNTLSGNTVSGMEHYGISVSESSDSNTISNNVISNCADAGIRVSNSQENTIQSNTFISNIDYGVNLWDSPNTVIVENSLEGSLTPTINGIGIYSNSGSTTIAANDVSHYNTGISVSGGSSVSSNNASYNAESGFHSCAISGTTFINNIASHNKYGLSLLGESNYNQVTGNEFSSNTEAGVKVVSSGHNTFRANIIQSNTGGVVMGADARYNSFYGNFIDSSGEDGVTLWGHSDYNDFDNNTLSNNGRYGVFLHDSAGNEFRNTTVVSTYFGFYCSPGATSNVDNGFNSCGSQSGCSVTQSGWLSSCP